MIIHNPWIYDWILDIILIHTQSLSLTTKIKVDEELKQNQTPSYICHVSLSTNKLSSVDSISYLYK